ncbi:PP2C family protein-serine/threonine phosphatase [Miniphocaeibacter massiliensis]|uniref:PP2C family protein-serine/threonine phosphatase n=1 Tax=Miniphocaeibacter massiliensis TaxID=2041841 RepID=UPI000C1BA070|nr:PP2C family protein-serine/threonine phosphatase [Miniphocaeibacter massiliensis]
MVKGKPLARKNSEHINYKSIMFPCEYLSDWIRMIDTEGTIIYQNQIMIEECGNLIGKNSYIEDSHDLGIPAGVKLEKFKDKDIVTRELEFDDEIFFVRSTLVYDENEKVIAIVEDFRNITSEVIAIKSLEHNARKNRKELDAARNIQRGILPEKGNHNGLLVEYKYIPSQFLSGDMFDVIKIDDHRVGVYIADVVGHGLSSSLITMFIRQTVRYLIKGKKIANPNKVLRNLIARFEELQLADNIYFTIFYGVFDTRTNEYKYANAGHNAIPIKIGIDGKIELLEGKGLPISLIFTKGKYVENTINLQKGERILFYTDGITETKDYFNELFGIDNLINTIKKNNLNLLDDIVNSVSMYRWGAQEDDIALLLIERVEGKDVD